MLTIRMPRVAVCLTVTLVTLASAGCDSEIKTDAEHRTESEENPVVDEVALSEIEINPLELLVAKPGETVVVTGRNFRPGMQALVMGTAVDMLVETTTRATFVMPDDAGSGVVDVSFKLNDTVVSTASLVSDGANDSLPIMVVAPELVCKDVSFRNAKGEVKAGLRDCALTDCQSDGQINCRANNLVKGAVIAGLAAKVVVGQTVAGVSGQAAAGGNPTPCAADGATDCLASASFPAAEASGLAAKVLSGQTVAGVAGNLTLPPVTKVLTGTSYGSSGNSQTGSLTLPQADKVLSGSGIYGIGGTGTTPTLTLPAASVVLVGSGTYGNPNAPLTPSYAPDFPSAANVRVNDTVNGAAGTLGDCATDGGTSCVAVAGYPAAKVDAAHLNEANIKRGVSIGGITGRFPSATYPLSRYSSDSGSSTSIQGSGGVTTDLTTFATQLTSAGNFEFWDKNGVRYTGSGDADIAAANIKNAVQFENLSITGSYTASANLDVWDVRVGVDRGDGQLGKLKVNCRNGIDSSYYNYDGSTAFVPTGNNNSGTTYDWWDSIDDYNGLSSGLPADWSTNNYCGGVESTAGDNNVWKDVTTGGCDGTKCRYKDKISGLEWSKTVHTSHSWPQAIADCADLTLDGVSDWRLPTQKELLEAHAHGIASAANADWITLAQMQATYFWSATTNGSYQSYAWQVHLAYGIANGDGKPASYQVTCVR